MYCENELCIYQEDNECILNEIEIDYAGMCRSCLTVSIPETQLTEMKRAERESLDED